ncbi:MAG: UDP-N-acetylglucosamine--N-acetylmuramyl-(pentapeptide) pyrophosphoryl-undecaprenol N-acetylglucosamine transferase [Candidatus Pacebacteria bacterium]|nr:UDP-N-acetylglucosamine--N-acetylmuramyl-(pentapeptide) pyrophosphoryl-undecaprenol N-acetylglucosamine transferase [Candidatus Paceibacterota bacterium]
MRIVFTGGGTGGHFYPIIAVAEKVRSIAAEQKLLPPKMYYFGPEPFDARALFELDIEHRYSSAGKMRTYPSIWNYIDMAKTLWGAFLALIQLFVIYPDVVFSKGGYASFPTVFAARLLRIPVVVHESDAVMGRANAWAAKFADSIAISYPGVAKEFGDERVALTGNPIREDLFRPEKEGAFEYLNLEPSVPVILILGGSQGAQAINDTVIDALAELLPRFQVIHQTGEKNLESVERRASVLLADPQQKRRYHTFGLLNTLALRMAYGAADLVISRAGSGGIFETAAAHKPSIIIPIPRDISRDQSTNAFSYARSGAAIVIEQNNLTPHLLSSEIIRLFDNPDEMEKMGKAAEGFARSDAANVIAKKLVNIGIEHEN